MYFLNHFKAAWNVRRSSANVKASKGKSHGQESRIEKAGRFPAPNLLTFFLDWWR